MPTSIPDLFPRTFGYDTYLRRRQAEMDKKRSELRGEAVDRATLDSYVGTYRIDEGATGAIEIEVRRDDDKLIALTNGKDEVELLPRSDSEFFVVDEKGTQFIRFVRDDSGEVISMDTRMPDLGW